MGNEREETIELQEHRAMINLPENTVDLIVIAKVYHDGELVQVRKQYGISDIRAMFQKADDGYVDENDQFVLTEAGLAFLEEEEAKRKLQ